MILNPPKSRNRYPIPLGMMDTQDPIRVPKSRIKAFPESEKKNIAGTRMVKKPVDTKGLITSGSVKPFINILKGSVVSIVRIPVPIGKNLYLELRPRNFKGKSTSTIFIQDASKRHIRLDYGYNKRTGSVDYHWQQEKGLSETFKITNHQPAGKWGKWLYRLGKTTKYIGRIFVVFALITDIYHITIAEKPLRRASRATGGWVIGIRGCKQVGSWGAAFGYRLHPLFGTIILGGLGCVAGGIGGGYLGDRMGSEVYDLAETGYYRILQPEQTEYFDN
jgi:hypothetical protein